MKRTIITAVLLCIALYYPLFGQEGFPPYQIITIQQNGYDFQKNAERLYNRGRESINYQRTIPEMAHYERTMYADRNIFLIYGAHFNPEHINNMTAEYFSLLRQRSRRCFPARVKLLVMFNRTKGRKNA